jgi:hypothetical protein
MNATILLVEDDPGQVLTFSDVLRAKGSKVEQRWLEPRVVDGCICTVPPFTGFQSTVAAAIKQCKSRVG